MVDAPDSKSGHSNGVGSIHLLLPTLLSYDIFEIYIGLLNHFTKRRHLVSCLFHLLNRFSIPSEIILNQGFNKIKIFFMRNLYFILSFIQYLAT